MTEYVKTLPVPDALTQPFWSAAREGRLLLQRCRECGAPQFYPRGHCRQCWADALDWETARGTGMVYSFTVTHHNSAPGFCDELPYVFALIDLDEGVRVSANIIDCPMDEIRLGMPVAVTFVPAGPELMLPQFTRRD